MMDLRRIAAALGGEIAGRQVVAPGPNHGPRDRSLSVWLAATPCGFTTYSHAGDDWRLCRVYVAERLGLRRDLLEPQISQRRPKGVSKTPFPDDRSALALWREGADPRGTLAQAYLARRGLNLEADVAGEVLRWHPRLGAMLALFRNIETGRPQAISRIFLDRDGRKLGRKFLGPVGGAAVMLDPGDAVLAGLHVGEGVETCPAARQLGLRPTWALGSAGAVAAFAVLVGIEALTLLAEHDDASARAVKTCATRWATAGLEVFIVEPNGGKDLNDALARQGP